MYSRTSFIVRLFVSLIVLGLLTAAGFFAYRIGFEQGYVQGVALSAPSGEAPPASPYLPYYPGYVRPHYGFFSFIPFLGCLLVGLLIFMVAGSMFGMRRWGHPGRHWHHRGPWGTPPWEKERPSGESGTETQPPGSQPETV